MTNPNRCLASLARLSLSPSFRPILQTTIPRVLAPAAIAQQKRTAASVNKNKNVKPKKKVSKFFPTDSLEKLPKFTLCDSMRYLRAWEVGQDPNAIKYDLAIKIKTMRTAPGIRNRMILPHPVATNRRIGVICKEGSTLASQALAAGAIAVGEDSLFETIREGTIEFTAMICASTSAEALRRANLGRILGPKGIMPSVKTKTIVSDVIPLLEEMNSAEMYRERNGVVRFPVGQLWFSPEMLAENVKVAIQQVRTDCQALIGQSAVPKQLFEIVLSSTNGPGFSLNGSFKSTEPGISTHALSGPM